MDHSAQMKMLFHFIDNFKSSFEREGHPFIWINVDVSDGNIQSQAQRYRLAIQTVVESGQWGIIVTSSFPDAEYLHWPAENLELRILDDGSVHATGSHALSALEKLFSMAYPQACEVPSAIAIRYCRMSEIK